ncbi:hypothetical protein NLU13_7220 [Sarocladium strictum]|uniref:General negative regulator of transcription subunit 4 n=1 Tax=Sarocladium strictum TaxID=5046 RepID=A0AA39GCE2_SARSR|nr:hypothetical protein NLU13_7220 [Sarocladium strictum]
MAPQDSFIEEEEDTCPLCVEEFDLSDRNFRPCPCGYQICQFCFNNIKNNMNGLCPACRRPYDEKTIQWKVVTSEEVAEFRANIQKNQRKRAQDQRQKELQKREAEKENRKNLIGVRVVQKNLVYITGLAPTVREEDLLKTLRKPEFFGQYGNIQKISISNRKGSDGQNLSLGVYVTFEKPEEATRCIQAVHGSHNGDRVLKAQHGTTKYCSAWLKNEKCNNPGCMFLHEQGDEEDSYTRQDLSSMNSIHTQRPLPGGGTSSRNSNRQAPTHPAPLPASQPVPQPVSQPMARTASKEGSESGVDSSALPSSANWARNPVRSRRGSHATSGAASSPAISHALPATTEVVEEAVQDAEESPAPQPAPAAQPTAQIKTKDPAQRLAESTLKALIKALQGCTLPSVSDADLETAPPMFDIRGGERRKAMREEEDARLAGDQEDAALTQGPSDGEPEAGGSLALGGEPEDREMGSESQGFDQRRAQQPIQRGSNDGMFGPALGGSGFTQGSAGVPGRTLTPQQLFSMRSQSGFADQMPPGIGGQASFQNQGHNRQSSRFSFANDNTNSATNVKLAANPRIMAQQNSMMPNSFQTQSGGSQFYPTSMPGPPPGLKSTGTPPSMFGQGFGASGFGGAPKESSNDLLQTLLVGRNNRGGNSQAHDSGKPPASGLMASLYGTPPGAFQDYGSKQKKKGKKHRHANTSSSGGSGLVDLADPSILQARMQYQAQSNAGVGQGLFGSQSQDDELPSLEEAQQSVDALVSDEPLQTLGGIDSRSASPTKRPPPGFSEEATNTSTAQSTPRIPRIVPVVPKVPPVTAAPGVVTPQQTPRKGSAVAADAKRSTTATPDGNEKSGELSKSALDDEMFPSLGSVMAREKRTGSPAVPSVPTPKKTPASKKSNEKAAKALKTVLEPENFASVASRSDAGVPSANASAVASAAASPSPAKAVPVTSKEPTPSEASVVASSSAYPPLPSAKDSSVNRTGPKTLRVVPSTKTDNKPLASPAASRAVSVSLARPDTPASDMASDSASMVSASVSHSRAGSPPPSRVGAAAVRSTTKSQQRKQRKDALKQDTKQIVEAPKAAEPEEHAPVIGRKKKQKKEQPPKQVAKKAEKQEKSVPVKSPAVETHKDSEKEKQKDKPAEPASESKVAAQVPAKTTQTRESDKSKKEKKTEPEQPKAQAQQAQQYPVEPIESEDPADRQQLGPASIFADIKKSLWTSAIEKLQLLKPVSSAAARVDTNHAAAVSRKAAPPCKDDNCKCGEIQEEDLAALRAGKPVRKNFHLDGSRMLITPNGDCVRNLTPEEEDAFLELQAAVAATASHPGTFVAPRHQPGSGAFSLIKGRAVPNGRPNIFPATAHPPNSDPIGKLQREDALSYINQYILPPLNLGTTNPSLAKGSSPTRDAAAASLNTLAPYFYGPDAAAGVGIYSPPDGMRAMQDLAGPLGRVGEGDKMALAGAPGAGPGAGGSMPIMSVEDAESAMLTARRETEKLEKGLNQVIKRNRRLLLGNGN